MNRPGRPTVTVAPVHHAADSGSGQRCEAGDREQAAEAGGGVPRDRLPDRCSDASSTAPASRSASSSPVPAAVVMA